MKMKENRNRKGQPFTRVDGKPSDASCKKIETLWNVRANLIADLIRGASNQICSQSYVF